jgi:hypothetical protein
MRAKIISIVAVIIILVAGLYFAGDWVWRTSNEVIMSMHETTAALHEIAARRPMPLGAQLREIRFTDGTSMYFTNGSKYEGHFVARAATSYADNCLIIEVRLAAPEPGTAHLTIPYSQIRQVLYEPKLTTTNAGR